MNRIQKIKNYFYPSPETPKVEKGIVTTGATMIRRQERDLTSVINALSAAERELDKRKTDLYDIYQECTEYDAHLYSVLQRRTQNITGRVLKYTVGNTEDKKLKALFNNQDFKGLLSEIIGAVFFGHTVIQFTETPFQYQSFDRRLIDGDKKGVRKSRLNMTLQPYADEQGTFENILEVGNVWDLGLMKQAVIYSILKRNMLGDWALYVQKAGNNFEKITYKGDKVMASKVAKAFNEAGAGAAIPIPDGVIDIQAMNTSSSSQNQLFVDFFNSLNGEISKLVLGQTMTTENGSSYSQSIVHLSQQELIFESDAEWVLSLLNSKEFKKILRYMKINDAGEFSFENQVISLQDEIEKDLKLKELGVVFPVGYLNKKYGIDES